MSTPKENMTKIYRAYMPEMIEIVVNTYEQYRNLKLPKSCAPYQVNRKRFNDDFWKEVIKEHIRYRFSPEHTISFGRKMCGGQMPWPDLVRKLPGMIDIDSRWQSKLNQIALDTFNLGNFGKCNTPQQLDEAVQLWNSRNPNTSCPNDLMDFCAELASRNWSFLLRDSAGRGLIAIVLLRALEKDGLEKLSRALGTHLGELADQL